MNKPTKNIRRILGASFFGGVIACAPVDWAAAQTGVTASVDPTVALATPAQPNTVDRYRAVFDDWVAKHDPKSAILVVRRAGRTVFMRGHGADPAKPTMIASLSKPITGACVATLINQDKLSFTTRLREGLSRFFTRYGTPQDRRLENVTVEELLVHRSGLVGNDDDDPLYGVVAKRANSGKGYLSTIRAMLGGYLVKLHLIRDPGQTYSYSNTGYEVLSAMIEERTGRPYEDYCREAVFGKLGIAEPRLHPDWRMLSGAGGWFIPGADYLAFLDIYNPANPFLNDTVKGWIDHAQTRWTPANHDRWYALGINAWSGAGRWTVSHGGILNSRGKDAEGRPIEASVVSHAYRAPDGTAVFIALNWSPSAAHDLDELRQEIGDTHKLVTVLPQ
jgi:CubicO group peptidase (beta-lactamase class C family)